MKKYRNKQSYSLKSQALNILVIESDGPASATTKEKEQPGRVALFFVHS